MKLSMIFARSADNVIGVDGDLPWHCPADLINFKKITSRPNVAVVMGRNTWNSLPVRPLPGRMNIVVTSNPENITKIEGIDTTVLGRAVVWARSIEDGIKYAEHIGLEELMFIGGAQIYEAVKDIVDEVHITEMNLIVGNVEGVKTIFDHDFVHYLWPDPENADWTVLDKWPCWDSETGKELFEYIHLVRK